MTQLEICDVNKLELTENSNFIKIVLKLRKSYTVTVTILNLLQLSICCFRHCCKWFFASCDVMFNCHQILLNVGKK